MTNDGIRQHGATDRLGFAARVTSDFDRFPQQRPTDEL
jgi:hypothetical protein